MTQPILIAGVPGGVGQQLVGKLLSQDQPVRAIVRSLAEGQALFSPHDNLQLAEADLSQPDTLPPALAGVRAVICSVRARNETSPGSMSPVRVLIVSPAAGVNAIVVSMLLPPRTAAMLAPFPRCARITRPRLLSTPATRVSSSIR